MRLICIAFICVLKHTYLRRGKREFQVIEVEQLYAILGKNNNINLLSNNGPLIGRNNEGEAVVLELCNLAAARL